jgi:hypothetical protein
LEEARNASLFAEFEYVEATLPMAILGIDVLRRHSCKENKKHQYSEFVPTLWKAADGASNRSLAQECAQLYQSERVKFGNK